ncbi:MCAK-like kinesin [Anopheles sinensis]|uniref:MCAK-like kinesin n=1 Tax=Anopheles sinensis TaxID=74873 RepID=A0A084W158_ANOSI|nr:MCAK-like kinesin [Anopheles sinensis]
MNFDEGRMNSLAVFRKSTSLIRPVAGSPGSSGVGQCHTECGSVGKTVAGAQFTRG